MTISELIKELQSLMEKYGDIEVVIPATDECYYGNIYIQHIEVNRDPTTLEAVSIELM